MAPLQCESPIDSLPEELLCMIFDLLELQNVKDASCTCRRWHDIIFFRPLRALTQPDQPLVFTYLKRLVLTDCAVHLKGRCKLNRLTHVETLELAIHDIEDWLLPALYDKCTALRHLYFGTFLRNVDIAILRQLSKFTHLRHLTFRAIQMKDRLPLDIDFGLAELTQLELLDLGSDVLLDRNLMRLPKSIKYLTLQITSTNEEVAIETISRNLTELQKLHLIYQCNTYVEVPKQTMKSICLLKQLEVLVFEFAKFTESVFLDVEAPMYQMPELLFAFCEWDRDLDLEWREIFPNLKKIQFPLSSPKFYFRKEIQLDSL